MEIRTVVNLSEKLATCENKNIIESILQEVATGNNYILAYNKSNETLYIDKKDFPIIEDLTEKELIELEDHIISTYNDKNVIYGYINLSDETQLRIFKKEFTV